MEEIATLRGVNKRQFIPYLMTKKYFYHKLTFKSLFLCLMILRKLITDHHIENIAISKIGCGLDKLQEVKMILYWIFQDVSVKILICSI